MSVIIVGGGMTGATLALAISHLTQGRLGVHLVEASAVQTLAHPGFDARAIALADGSCQQLARIGVWQAIADCATAITRVQVSDRGHAGCVTLDARDYQLAALGQVVELYDVGQRLFPLLRKAPGVMLHCPERVAAVSRTPASVSVTLESGARLTGSVLAAADGTRSSIGSACGIGWQQHPYQQVAVIANVTTEVNHGGRAFERFTEQGPLAMLPGAQGRCSLVWCHPCTRQDEVMSWCDDRFRCELQRAFGWRLGRIAHVGERSVWPLALIRATRQVTHRLALLGNAAQTLHPIAGQGFNLGLRDAMTLAETLTEAWQTGQDIGGYSVLCRYQQRRSADKAATIGITDGLARLFSNRWGPLVVGRNAGLMAMELCTPARDALARRALGWVPR